MHKKGQSRKDSARAEAEQEKEVKVERRSDQKVTQCMRQEEEQKHKKSRR